MLNLEIDQITVIWDVIWLFCMYYECENSKMTKTLTVVSLQVQRTVDSDDSDDDQIVNEAGPQLKLEEREDGDSDITDTESSFSQVSNDENGSNIPLGQDVRQVSKVACKIRVLERQFSSQWYRTILV